MKKNWGFDTRDIDTSVRPQDDFYHYASGGWMKRNPIPKAESRWGSFVILRYETEKKLKQLITRSSDKMIRDFYASGMDMKRRTQLGINPITPYLKKIDGIKTKDDLLACIAELHTIGISVIWGCGVDQDMKNGDMHILYLGQSGLGMPDRDYYLNDDVESKRVRDAYHPHISNIFQLSGIEKTSARGMAEKVYGIEQRLARASMPKEETHEIEKIYNKRSLAQLKKISPEIDWVTYFTRIGAKKPKIAVVCQPNFFAEASACIREIPLGEWRLYLTWHLLNSFSSFLSPEFERQNFKFYGTVLSGTNEMRPLWRRVLAVVNGSLLELIGKEYVKKYFSPKTKKMADAMVDDLFTAYEIRIKKLDWMSPKTRKEAIKKLRAMTRKIGYPEKWKSYRGLHIDAHDYVGNVIRSSVFENQRMMRKLGKPVDRKEWLMGSQTINAYCNPSMNEIVFPAAILQPPFFSPLNDAAINYGTMGEVIGHEMTHNFDDQGSKFDTKGNLREWWAKEDRKRFTSKSKPLIAQFNAYRVADNVPVNGKLTLGENIADLGGLSIAFDAYQLHLARTGRKDIGGFTPEQRFFFGHALFERQNTRPEIEKMQAINDPHSPAQFRVNGVVSNLDEFYEAFDVKKGDKLYRAQKDRAKIW
ncbi:MAG: M13 family metallopeptidase [Candidatus Kaiserbacteria bacterium]|nr:M13 family metallopeptidase [Candidatus Kaiserbacteria bacterium]